MKITNQRWYSKLMWIFTNFGFFSAVQHYENPSLLVIRARSKKDLESLITKYGSQLNVKMRDITTNEHSDYRHRVFVDRSNWMYAMTHIINDIDYTNFKDSVHQNMGPERAHLCSDVWSTMYQVQMSEIRKERDNHLNRD